MLKTIVSIIAPATLALTFLVSAEAEAAMDPAKYKACLASTSKCMTRCNQVYTTTDRIAACLDRCMAAESACFKRAESPGKFDTGGTASNPKDPSTKAGGGVFTQPSPPSGGGSGAIFNSPKAK